jgi:aminopeptidase N
MWFGDLVTPLWWDDLWLNESFAEYMGARVTADATEFTEVWVTQTHTRRPWGLAADQRPSTHPVAGNGAADGATALQNFDGISYAKGATIIKQLHARLGDEVFFRGVSDHFEKHRFGNATMADLLDSWERAGAGDLTSFSDGWLLTAGPDTIQLDRKACVLLRTPLEGHPADRDHTLGLATATAGSPGDWKIEPLRLDTDAVPVAVPAGPVVPDAHAETWAVTLLDPETMAALPEVLPPTADPLVRASIWCSVRNAFQHALIGPEEVLDLVEVALPAEDTDDGVGQTLGWAFWDVVPTADDPRAALARVHSAAGRCVAGAGAGSSLQLAALQIQVAAADDADVLRDWLASGDSLPDGVVVDLELRWRILLRLAKLGGVDRDQLAAALAEETTAVSQVEHAKALAALPDAEAKAWAWQRFTGEVEVPNYELEAIGLGLWQVGQEHLTDPYVARYFDEVLATTEVRSSQMLAVATKIFYPRWSATEDTVARAHALLGRDDVDSTIRREIVDETWDLERRLAVRQAFGR